MNREDHILAAIRGRPWQIFQRFGIELVSRELYTDLNPSSLTHDMGQDAHDEHSTRLLRSERPGERITVAVSQECSLHKVMRDCRRCVETGRSIDRFVFVTAGDVRTDIEDDWRSQVKAKFGWELEVRSSRWIVRAAGRPQHESLVDEYLQIPPPGGDYVDAIAQRFSDETRRGLKRIRIRITGLGEPIDRVETSRIEDQLGREKPVLLTGELGTGKSGIAYCLATSAAQVGKAVLLLDARRVGHVHAQADLASYLGLRGPLDQAVVRLARYKTGCRFVVDQLDSVSGLHAEQVLTDLACDLVERECVEVVVVSRRTESQEERTAKRLTQEGFAEIVSHPLSEGKARRVLEQLGIDKPTAELAELARNLLNLELIGRIRQERPEVALATLSDEVELWEQYVEALQEREALASRAGLPDEMLGEVARLSRRGLRNTDRTFRLQRPLSPAQKRLVSCGIIAPEEGLVFRFRHDKQQDFFYARDAADRCLMPPAVLAEIPEFRTRTIFDWMARLYERRESKYHVPFLKGVFDVNW